jgi:hypothetical protein
MERCRQRSGSPISGTDVRVAVRGETSRGETVVRLLGVIRKRRSQIRLALQPAPAEIEAALLNERDIKARLHQEIAAAQQSGHGPWPSVKQANLEAAQRFKPILKAMQHLAQELAGHEHVTVTMRANEVELALGQERRISASRYGWQREFAVEDHISCPDLGASVERTSVFPTPDDVMTFLIRACAEFLARQAADGIARGQ